MRNVRAETRVIILFVMCVRVCVCACACVSVVIVGTLAVKTITTRNYLSCSLETFVGVLLLLLLLWLRQLLRFSIVAVITYYYCCLPLNKCRALFSSHAPVSHRPAPPQIDDLASTLQHWSRERPLSLSLSLSRPLSAADRRSN